MPKLSLALDEFARNDIDEAASWYGAVSVSVRKKFIEALTAIFKLIQEHPLGFPITYRDFRKALLPHFPYMAIYRIAQDEIVVYAVIHTRRNPTTWLERMR